MFNYSIRVRKLNLYIRIMIMCYMRLNSPVNNLFDPVSRTLPQIYTEYNLNIIQLDKKLEIEKFDNKHYFRFYMYNRYLESLYENMNYIEKKIQIILLVKLN